MDIKDFSYTLPQSKIALYPLTNRDHSKLLVYESGKINSAIFNQIDDHIPANSFMAFNNTRVIEARLIFKKETGSEIEIFCLEPNENIPPSQALMQRQRIQYKCLIGGASKWKNTTTLQLPLNNCILNADLISRSNNEFIVSLSWNNDLTFAEILQQAGNIPLPPYINRKAEREDQNNYQTVFAKNNGSVAAPTAGLHFTEKVFEQLHHKKISTEFITLHVGAGTFMPVKTEKIEEHKMHAEFIEVKKTFIEKLLASFDENIIAVGTTSLRTLESIYWIGINILQKKGDLQNAEVDQWQPYEKGIFPDTKTVLENLLSEMHKQNQPKIIAKTSLMIIPGYSFKIVNGLVTNFHQPNSTLLLLVAAFIGENWKRVYEYALNNDYRFLSYGDGSILWNSKK